MAKNTQQEKTINQVLIEQLMLNVGKISQVIETQGKNIFCQANILSKDEINDYSLEFLELFVAFLQAGKEIDRRGSEFRALRQFFTTFSQQIQVRGGTLEEFVRYIQFLQSVMLAEMESDQGTGFEQTKGILLLLASVFNDIILDVFHIYLGEREKTISAQQDELKEVSTPITEIWDGVLTLPIIGTLDSSRTMMVMERLLSKIESERSKVVVMDITGVMAIDSQVSHHLIQMIRAINLMGADAILTGIRPEIARALTSLNIDLGGVVTRSTLSEGLKEAFRILHIEVSSICNR